MCLLNTLVALSSFAGLLRARCRLDESEPLFREALAACRRIHPRGHPEVLTTANNLGMVLAEMGRLSEAETLLREALAGRQAALGEGHPSTRGIAAALETVLQRQRDGGGGGGGAQRECQASAQS